MIKASNGLLPCHTLITMDPKVQAIGQPSSAKVPFTTLRLAALGCLFSRWGLNHRDYLEAANFISNLWEMIGEDDKGLSEVPLQQRFSWLWFFVQAAHDLLYAKSHSPKLFKEFSTVVEHGSRRRQFLGPEEENFAPYFGLTNRHVLEALPQGRRR